MMALPFTRGHRPGTGKPISGGINLRGNRGDARIIAGSVKTGGPEGDVQSRVCLVRPTRRKQDSMRVF